MRVISGENKIDISPVGQVVDTPAEIDDNGEVIKEPTFKPGFFVCASDPVPEWAAFLVDDGSTPPRIFAGRADTSTTYNFADFDAFQAAYNAIAEPEPEQPPIPDIEP